MSSRKSHNQYRSGTRSPSTIHKIRQEIMKRQMENQKQVEDNLAIRMCKTNVKDKNTYPVLVKELVKKMDTLEPLTMQNFRSVLLKMCNLNDSDNKTQKDVLTNVLRIVQVHEKAYQSVLSVLGKKEAYFDPEVIEEYEVKIKQMKMISHYIGLFFNTTENPILKRGGKWSAKYKRSIDCKRPKGFSQKQHCKYGRKTRKHK